MRYTRAASFLFKKRGVFYFSRRVPRDLLEHYKASRIAISLKTKSLRIAQTRAVTLSSKLDEDWLTLRWRSSNDPFHRFLQVEPAVSANLSSAPLMSEARETYLEAKASGRGKTFVQAAERSVRYLMQIHGDRPIDLYSRTDVNKLRDALLERGLQTSSIRRTISSIRAIMNFNCLELGLKDITSFSGVYLGQTDHQSEARRKPISDEHIIQIQQESKFPIKHVAFKVGQFALKGICVVW
jgi:hypothetical protein